MTKYAVKRTAINKKYYCFKDKRWVKNISEATLFHWWNIFRYFYLWNLKSKDPSTTLKFAKIESLRTK